MTTERHPFRIDLGQDPEVREFIRHTYSIDGMRGAAPPALSDEQLEKVDPICQQIEKIIQNKEIQTWENVVEYLARHVTCISGMFKGGTTYATNFLKSLGFLAGHEQIFSADNNFYLKSMIATQLDIEISGGLPPWISSLKRRSGSTEIRYLTVVRHPVALINSRYNFQPPKVQGDTLGLQRDVLTQLELNVGVRVPEYIWRIESESDQMDVLDMFGKRSKIKPGELERARKANRNRTVGTTSTVVTWDNLMEPLKDWATDLGYLPDGGLRK